MDTLTIYVPRNKEDSKCWHVFKPMIESFDGLDVNVEYDYVYRGGMGMCWGFVGNNERMLKLAQENNDPFIFADMPYFGRWNGLKEALDPSAEFYWRMSVGDVHPTNWTYPQDSARFGKHGLPVIENRDRGDEILICPSSETMTRYTHGVSVDEWVHQTMLKLIRGSKKPIRVRYKPRKNGTSGPSVADIPFEKDVENAWCVVTSLSMCAVEAVRLGLPVIETSKSAPVGWATGINRIETVDELVDPPTPNYVRGRLNFLANCQFTPSEIRSGLALDYLREYQLLGRSHQS